MVYKLVTQEVTRSHMAITHEDTICDCHPDTSKDQNLRLFASRFGHCYQKTADFAANKFKYR
uniref:(California timema) hypothetical protein n=1 Tax=Timema californicum TaxID=61474 RepID=A0A7R9PFA8_TIMCA|nr:unnamed protein product [Timema californicum]